MNEVNNAVENVGTSKSMETDLPVEDYIERLNGKLEEFSSTMFVDTEALTNEPEEGESWDQIEHYLKCIEISQEQPKNILLPYWGSVELPTPEELADPNTEDYTPEDVLGRLFVVNATLDVEFDYYNQDTSEEESMSLGQLIADVYPGLEGGMKDIRKELELAFRNPEEFKKKFSKKENSSLVSLTRRAFIRKGVEVTAATLFVLTSMSLAGCSGKEVQTESTPVIETYTPTSTKTEEPTPTPTETQVPSPTPRNTETPEPTVIVDGGTIEDIERNMEEGDLIWSMVELQKIVNSYDESSGQEFSEYIAEVRQAIPSGELEYGRNYWGLDRVLGKLENLGEISTMSLIYSLEDSFPSLIIPNIPEGYDSVKDLLEDLPEDFKQEIVDYAKRSEKEISMERVFFYGLYPEDKGVYGSRGILLQSEDYKNQDVVTIRGWIRIDGYNYYENGFPDFINTVVSVGTVEKDGTAYSMGVMVDDEPQIRLVILSSEGASKIFTGSYQIGIVPDRALFQRGSHR